MSNSITLRRAPTRRSSKVVPEHDAVPAPQEAPAGATDLAQQQADSDYQMMLEQSARGPAALYMLITPQLAQLMLERNDDNRRLKQHKMVQLVSDFQSGKFEVNGESIIMATDGFLNDGQHRLLACLRTGVAFHAFVSLGVTRASRFTVDSGSIQTAGDRLSQQKVPNGGTAASLARAVISWEQTRSLASKVRVSSAEQQDRVLSDTALAFSVSWAVNAARRVKGMYSPTMSGFFHYVLTGIAPLEGEEFMTILRDGTDLSVDSVIYLLREKLRANPQLTDVVRAEATVRTWNKWYADPGAKAKYLKLSGEIPDIAGANKVK